MKIAIMADGEWDFSWGQIELKKRKFDLLICADGGANLAVASGIMPDVLIGDLDSVTNENLKKCREKGTDIIKYLAEKDQTDLELAVDYAENYLKTHGRPEDEILLYAAGGKRLDHLLGNIAIMLGAAQKKRRIIMADKNFSSWVMVTGKEKITGTVGQQMSIIPLSEKAVVCSHGLYYELNDLVLWQNTARGVSNVFQQTQIELEVLQGNVLIVMLTM